MLLHSSCFLTSMLHRGLRTESTSIIVFPAALQTKPAGSSFVLAAIRALNNIHAQGIGAAVDQRYRPCTIHFPAPSSCSFVHFTPPAHKPKQNSPKSPFVPSRTSCSSLFPYFRLYSCFTFSRCFGSQWKRTSLLTSKSVRSLLVSLMA